MEKKFIEWDLPLKEISKGSAKEKNVHIGLPPQFHVWWARRPLVASRATILATLLDLPDSPSKREDISDIIETLSSWDVAKGEKKSTLKKARKMISNQYDSPPKVIDPFSGGGSIPLEALRLGCETFSGDYNPVAVLIEKATLKWPQEFGKTIKIPLQEATERELKNKGYKKSQIREIKKGSFSQIKEENGEIEVNLLFHLVETWSRKIFRESREEIGKFYPSTNSENLIGKEEIRKETKWIPVSYIWARTVPCQNPTCNATIPLIRQFWLSKKKNKKIAYVPKIENEENVNFEILTGKRLKEKIEKGFDPSEGTITRGNAECPVCEQVTQSEKIQELGKKGKMGRRMIVGVFHHPNETGKVYKIVEKNDKKIFSKAEKYLNEKIKEWDYLEEPLPKERIPEMSGTFNAPIYGLDEWQKLFNPRQKLVLVTFLEKIRESFDEILNDCQKILKDKKINSINSKELAKSIMGYLGLLLDRQVDFTSNLCVWDNSGEIHKHVFGRSALPMVWDYSEVNPFSGSSGSFESQMYYFFSSLENFSVDRGNVPRVKQFSATNLPIESATLDAVLTDPPYYNSVPYADLSDFFYVWLKRLLGDKFPDLFSTPLVPKSEEAVEMADWDPERYSNKDAEFFEKQLKQSFQEIHRVLKSGGVANIVYAHKTTEGWETVLNSLIDTDFIITASWPIHTEMKTRLRGKSSAALASSIYMVCRKANKQPVGFWKDIKPKIRNRVEEKLGQFWSEGVRGGDFFISAIGPGMEIFSQYEKVEDFSGDEVTTKNLLEYIRSITTDYVVDTLLKDASSTEIDSASQFYLAYRWTYLDNKVEFDDARRIASGMGIELDEFSGKDGFVKQSRKYTSVLGPQDREEVEKIDNMVDVMHKCVLLWDEGKSDEIKRLLSETGYGQKPAFWQFCQAVAETLLNGNKEKQLLEGFLTGKDKYSKSSKEDEQTGLDQFGGD